MAIMVKLIISCSVVWTALQTITIGDFNDYIKSNPYPPILRDFNDYIKRDFNKKK